MAEEKKDFKELINEKYLTKLEGMIKSIENNPNLEFELPWNKINEFPVNPSTGTKYSGINLWSLLALDNADNRYMTFNQVKDIENTRKNNWVKLNKIENDYKDNKISVNDYNEKKNEIEASFKKLEDMGLDDRTKSIYVKSKGSTPIYVAVSYDYTLEKENVLDNGVVEIDKQDRKLVRYKYVGSVFNGSQIENMKPYVSNPQYEYKPEESFELLIKAMEDKTGLVINHGGNRASYNFTTHTINMPNKEQFKTQAGYMDTLTHELGHSTAKALDRAISNKFGSKEYAYEELIAELTSQQMGMSLGIEHGTNHENRLAYLKGWYELIKEDKNIFFKAASQAQKASEYQLKILNEYRLENTQSIRSEGDLKAKVDTNISTRKEKTLTMGL